MQVSSLRQHSLYLWPTTAALFLSLALFGIQPTPLCSAPRTGLSAFRRRGLQRLSENGYEALLAIFAVSPLRAMAV
jgi:hypothetical protein